MYAVLMNTAIARANSPVLIASAMKKAVEAGREAYCVGRIPRKRFATASSASEGLFFESLAPVPYAGLKIIWFRSITSTKSYQPR